MNENVMYYYQNRDSERPVEELFSAIFTLQILDEYDNFTNGLKHEMEKLFEDVEEKNGKKVIKSVHYYPSGLCERKDKPEKVILKSWKNKTEGKNAIQRDYSLIKRMNLIWYMQFMDYIQKPLRVTKEKMAVREHAIFLKKYNPLCVEEKKIFAAEKVERIGQLREEYYKLFTVFKMDRFTRLLEFDTETNEWRMECKAFKLLNTEQLEDLKAVYESTLSKWEFEKRVAQMLERYKNQLYRSDDSMPGIDFSDLLKPTIHRKSLGWGTKEFDKMKYTVTIKDQFDAVLAIMDRLAETDDEKMKKLLKKIGI